jgi:hypothetical protein
MADDILSSDFDENGRIEGLDILKQALVGGNENALAWFFVNLYRVDPRDWILLKSNLSEPMISFMKGMEALWFGNTAFAKRHFEKAIARNCVFADIAYVELLPIKSIVSKDLQESLVKVSYYKKAIAKGSFFAKVLLGDYLASLYPFRNRLYTEQETLISEYNELISDLQTDQSQTRIYFFANKLNNNGYAVFKEKSLNVFLQASQSNKEKPRGKLQVARWFFEGKLDVSLCNIDVLDWQDLKTLFILFIRGDVGSAWDCISRMSTVHHYPEADFLCALIAKTAKFSREKLTSCFKQWRIPSSDAYKIVLALKAFVKTGNLNVFDHLKIDPTRKASLVELIGLVRFYLNQNPRRLKELATMVGESQETTASTKLLCANRQLKFNAVGRLENISEIKRALSVCDNDILAAIENAGELISQQDWVTLLENQAADHFTLRMNLRLLHARANLRSESATKKGQIETILSQATGDLGFISQDMFEAAGIGDQWEICKDSKNAKVMAMLKRAVFLGSARAIVCLAERLAGENEIVIQEDFDLLGIVGSPSHKNDENKARMLLKAACHGCSSALSELKTSKHVYFHRFDLSQLLTLYSMGVEKNYIARCIASLAKRGFPEAKYVLGLLVEDSIKKKAYFERLIGKEKECIITKCCEAASRGALLRDKFDLDEYCALEGELLQHLGLVSEAIQVCVEASAAIINQNAPEETRSEIVFEIDSKTGRVKDVDNFKLRLVEGNENAFALLLIKLRMLDPRDWVQLKAGLDEDFTLVMTGLEHVYYGRIQDSEKSFQTAMTSSSDQIKIFAILANNGFTSGKVTTTQVNVISTLYERAIKLGSQLAKVHYAEWLGTVALEDRVDLNDQVSMLKIEVSERSGRLLASAARNGALEKRFLYVSKYRQKCFRAFSEAYAKRQEVRQKWFNEIFGNTKKNLVMWRLTFKHGPIEAISQPSRVLEHPPIEAKYLDHRDMPTLFVMYLELNCINDIKVILRRAFETHDPIAQFLLGIMGDERALRNCFESSRLVESSKYIVEAFRILLSTGRFPANGLKLKESIKRPLVELMDLVVFYFEQNPGVREALATKVNISYSSGSQAKYGTSSSVTFRPCFKEVPLTKAMQATHKALFQL